VAPEWTRVVGCWMKVKKSSSGAEEVENVWPPVAEAGAGAGDRGGEYGWEVLGGSEVTLVWERRTEEAGVVGRDEGWDI
jgi:hypothetical protein